MSIYSSKIVKLGEQSELFLAEGIVVFFGDNAPEELQDVAVVHELKPVNGDIAVGTTIELSGEVLKVTSIGEVANENFKNLTAKEKAQLLKFLDDYAASAKKEKVADKKGKDKKGKSDLKKKKLGGPSKDKATDKNAKKGKVKK